MQHACCSWCLAKVKVSDKYNRFKHKAYCSPKCLQADWLFMQWQSDEAINRERHYQQLTRGRKDEGKD